MKDLPSWYPYTIWKKLIEPPLSLAPARRRQSQLLSAILVILIGLGLIASIIPNLFFPLGPWYENTGFLITLAVAGLLACAYILNRSRRYTAAALLAVLAISGGIFLDVLTTNNPDPSFSLFYLILPVLLASLLLSERATVGVVILNVLGVILLPLVLPQQTRFAELSTLTFLITLSAVILFTIHQRNLMEEDRQSELRAIIHQIPAGVTVQDESGRILYANDPYAHMIGLDSSKDVVDTTVTQILQTVQVINESGQVLSREQLPGYLALMGTPTDEQVFQFQLPGDERRRWVLVTTAPIVSRTDSARVAVNVYQDITALKRAEQTRQFMIEATALLNTALDYRVILENIANLASQTIADWCVVDIREAGKIRRLVTAHQNPDRIIMGNELIRRYPTPANADQGIAKVIRTGESEFYPQITPAMLERAARDPEHLRMLQSFGFRSLISVPLPAHNEILGAITFMLAETPHNYDETDLQLAQELGRRVALAVENAQLYEQTQRQRERLRVTLVSIGDAVITTDREGCITFMNRVAETCTGWPLDEARGKPLSEVFRIINEDTRQTVENPVEKVMREGAIVGLANHTLLISRDGKEYPIDDSGAPIRSEDGNIMGVVLVFRDVTDRKHAEDLIKRQADLLEFANDAIFVWEFGNHIIQWYRGAEQLYGWSADEAIGHVAHDLLQTQPAIGSWTDVEQSLKDTGLWTGELHHICRDGRRVYVESRLVLVRYPDGQQVVLEINHDITERKRAEEERQQLLEREQSARQQAEQAVRVRDEFLSVAAHELRTPITSMRGFAQVLLRQMDKGAMIELDKLHRALQKIDEQSDKLARLISQLLDVSRIEAGRLILNHEPVDLRAVAEDLMANAQMNTQRHKITLDAPDPVIVFADRLRIEQVIQNLLDNAIRYSPQGGPVTIQVSRAGDNAAQISVSDHGMGVPLELRGRLFERFYQAHEDMSVGGLGLGLYISRQIVELHGGTIRAEFPAEKGTRFIVTLPIS